VLWLALMGTPRGGVWLSFAAGLAVDAASGAPLGIFAACRLILYALGRPFRGKLEQSPIIFLLGPLAVWLEVGVIYTLKNLAFANPVEFSTLASMALRQSMTEVVALPVIFIVMELATGHRSGREVAA
jgi:cell shape-determining protein MreD